MSSGTLPTEMLFTGQRLDDNTELYYYNARYYDPEIGRFISPDTIVPDPYNPQSLNRYSYCMNNPLKYIDPTGHAVHLLGAIVIGAAVGAVAGAGIYGLFTAIDPNRTFSREGLGVATATGAVGGALAPIAPFVAEAVGVSSAIAAVGVAAAGNSIASVAGTVAGEALNSMLTGEPFDIDIYEILLSAGAGALMGGLISAGAVGTQVAKFSTMTSAQYAAGTAVISTGTSLATEGYNLAGSMQYQSQIGPSQELIDFQSQYGGTIKQMDTGEYYVSF